MMKKRIIVCVLVIAAAICAVFAVRGYLASRDAGEDYSGIRESVSAGHEESASAEEETVPVDFTELKKQCPDAYAWIHIDGTNVDYPIVQSADDQSYYLTHSAEKKNSKAGAIYTENLNKKDFSDPVTVIYGHNMKNGSMFRTLHNYEDRAFFDAHREILVYLPDEVLHYRVFAAYTTDDRHLLKSWDFSDRAQYQRYLDFVNAQKSMDSYVADDADVTPESRIIILSTCNGNSSQRYLVQAVLEK